MPKISRFQIKKLYGYRNLDLRFKDNTLILVGENGAGKTTVLNLLYYLLSGQWNSIIKYEFESLTITIGNKKHVLAYSDFKEPFKRINKKLPRHLPSAIRHRVIHLLEQSDDGVNLAELERICHRYNMPIRYLLEHIDLFDQPVQSRSGTLSKTLTTIQNSLKSQLLYLPTYRRIEQELNLIFEGLDERELHSRRRLLASKRTSNTFVELIEFGMKDVESAIHQTRDELEKFARENLNKLTFSYLGDIVEEEYQSVNLSIIKKADQRVIDSILSRIQEPILSQDNKQNLKSIIQGIKDDNLSNVHAKVISHYFTKLMGFHQDLEEKEAKIVSFCRACNDYMVDKEFIYDSSTFDFKIRAKDTNNRDRVISLQNLSSGEKQIVSLFSHLYLSGGEKYFVLIDEPELSLSVDWQRKFLADIRNADFCSGLVAVTHSPFIYDNELRAYAHGLGEFIV